MISSSAWLSVHDDMSRRKPLRVNSSRITIADLKLHILFDVLKLRLAQVPAVRPGDRVHHQGDGPGEDHDDDQEAENEGGHLGLAPFSKIRRKLSENVMSQPVRRRKLAWFRLSFRSSSEATRSLIFSFLMVMCRPM